MSSVLVWVDGGIADAITDDPSINIVVLDWDNVKEAFGGTGADYIEDYIEQIESLPDTKPFDRAGILADLRERLADMEGE